MMHLEVHYLYFFLSFNSPWECRIGLTEDGPSQRSTSFRSFQFPVGMSNRSYDSCFDVKWEDILKLSIPRGNVE